MGYPSRRLPWQLAPAASPRAHTHVHQARRHHTRPYGRERHDCIEAVLLARNCIGIDINMGAVMLTLHRLYWLRRYLEEHARQPEGRNTPIGEPGAPGGVSVEDMLGARVGIYHGDARSLNKIPDEGIDLVAAHPNTLTSKVQQVQDAGGPLRCQEPRGVSQDGE